MILLTAANGNQGKRPVPKLLVLKLPASGATLRARVSTETSAAQLCTLGVSDIIVGDVTDPQVLT